MSIAICTVAIMPLRVSSDDRSEMVSQVLFGESMEVLELMSNWALVRLSYDKYEGWVDPKQFSIIDDTEIDMLDSAKMHFSTDVVQLLNYKENKKNPPLVLGSSLPNLHNSKLAIAGTDYSYKGNSIISSVLPNREAIIENAYKYINAPYLWGGKTPFGVDCSGLTQMVYKISGIKLQRDASQQATQGETINFINDALEGDLAFFDNEEGNIMHVGIILGNNTIMHASGKVRIDKIDHQGIFNVEIQKYTHKLRLIKTWF